MSIAIVVTGFTVFATIFAALVGIDVLMFAVLIWLWFVVVVAWDAYLCEDTPTENRE